MASSIMRTRRTREGSMASGAPTNGWTARRGAATRRICGGSGTTSTTDAESKPSKSGLQTHTRDGDGCTRGCNARPWRGVWRSAVQPVGFPTQRRIHHLEHEGEPAVRRDRPALFEPDIQTHERWETVPVDRRKSLPDRRELQVGRSAVEEKP